MIHNFDVRNPGIFELRTAERTRCQNLILHGDGGLLGGARHAGCIRWRLDANRLYFFDHSGYARYIFEPDENKRWVHRAAPKVINPTDRIKKHAVRLADGNLISLLLACADYELTAQTLPRREQFEIVVAKYREDVAWADPLRAVVTIYSKFPGDSGKYPVLVNWGREGGTYFHHIVERYDQLAERTLFLQGDPFPHSLLAFPDYAADSAPMTTARREVSRIKDTIPWSSPAQRIDEAAMRAFLSLVECDATIETFEWVQGAQFALSREQIRRRPRSYYQRLLQITQEEWLTLDGRKFDNHHVAWIFELFWRNIFLESVAG